MIFLTVLLHHLEALVTSSIWHVGHFSLALLITARIFCCFFRMLFCMFEHLFIFLHGLSVVSQLHVVCVIWLLSCCCWFQHIIILSIVRILRCIQSFYHTFCSLRLHLQLLFVCCFHRLPALLVIFCMCVLLSATFSSLSLLAFCLACFHVTVRSLSTCC